MRVEVGAYRTYRANCATQVRGTYTHTHTHTHTHTYTHTHTHTHTLTHNTHAHAKHHKGPWSRLDLEPESSSEVGQPRRDSVCIMDLTDHSFVFVVYFIRAHLRGAFLGTRTELGHGLIKVLEMAWVRQ